MRFFPKVSISFEEVELVEPSPAFVAAKELNEARMDKLKAERELEYWKSMVPMLESRIKRLAAIAGAEES